MKRFINDVTICDFVKTQNKSPKSNHQWNYKLFKTKSTKSEDVK